MILVQFRKRGFVFKRADAEKQELFLFGLHNEVDRKKRVLQQMTDRMELKDIIRQNTQ